jgi:hemerythrin-like domain-containing protein
MLESIFLSKNQKLVKSWEDEHKEIGALAGKIIESYENGDIKKTKKYLHELKDLTIEHLMQEDLAFYNLLKKSNGLDIQTIEHIKDFRETFKGTKTALMNFLSKYSSEDEEINDNFIKSFKGLVQIVVKRIGYEESNLYPILAKEK